MIKGDYKTVDEWQRAAEAGDERAVVILAAAGDDLSPERLYAESLIADGEQRIKEDGQFDYLPFGGEDSQPHSGDSLKEECERISREYGNEWLLSDKPDGTVLPPASGREMVRTPNLTSANLSFAARLIVYVRDKFGGNAPQVYRAAHVSRKTYSAIISNELRTVSKETAVSFALALKLSHEEAAALLRSAGHALSEFLLRDIVYQACIDAGIYDLDKVDKILCAHGVGPSSICQTERAPED